MRSAIERGGGEATCLMCGAIVGDVAKGKFTHHRGCERPVLYQGALPRCCRCGGSLYVSPSVQGARFAGLDELLAGRS